MNNINYASIFEDVRESQNGIHQDGTLKSIILSDPSTYVRRDERLNLLLERLRSQGKKTFLLTNSEYYYSNAIMKYMLEGTSKDHPSWKDYFDIIIVSGCKPKFFMSGTTMREVDEETGNLKFVEISKFEKGKVYHGGNLSQFKKFTGTTGAEVLYIGDNISHDVIFLFF
jgi:5'-nucleotidase